MSRDETLSFPIQTQNSGHYNWRKLYLMADAELIRLFTGKLLMSMQNIAFLGTLKMK